MCVCAYYSKHPADFNPTGTCPGSNPDENLVIGDNFSCLSPSAPFFVWKDGHPGIGLAKNGLRYRPILKPVKLRIPVRLCDSCQDFVKHVSMHIGQAPVNSVMPHGQLCVVDSQQMQRGGVDVVHLSGVVSIQRFVAPFV